ncbi:MAG: hypothetical protein GX813_03935 [Erysipelotrichia bacterium]|nr:hypothetical protein [Erysipelotrichia bacterium]
MDILPANTNQALSIIRINSNEIHHKFLLEMLNSQYIKEQLEGKKQGVAQINLSLQNIKDLIIALPNKEEQLKFVKFLEQVDKLKFEKRIQTD